jgi:hypothetical protein
MSCRLSSVRAQSSIEYLFIVVLALTLILPASYLFFDFSKNSEDAVVSAQINNFGNKVIASAEQVYVIGNNSRVTLELVLPDSLASAMIYDEKELVISYYTQSGLSQAVFFSDLNITNGTHRCYPVACSLQIFPGLNNVRVLSRGDYVSVSQS